MFSNSVIPKNNDRKKIFLSKTRKQYFFVLLILVLPLIQFGIFYLGVNINSILLAFKEYDTLTGATSWAGMKNFKKVIDDFYKLPQLKYALPNSLIVFVAGTFTGSLLTMIFSFYIYKKMRLSEVFRVILFIPSIIPGIVMVIMFKYFAESGYPYIVKMLTNKQVEGLLANNSTAFGTIVFSSLWFGFGGGTLMYAGTMSGINESIVDAGRIDGVTVIKEFIHITVPSIWNTIVTFFVASIGGILTNQIGLFSYFGTDAEAKYYTVGYYLFRSVQGNATNTSAYPYLAAFGLVLTAVAVPLTLGARKLLYKFGPSPD